MGAVEISVCGNKLCGHIYWLKEPNDKKGKPLVDMYNPDASKRRRAICGLPVFGNLARVGSSWDAGWVYDPKDGKSYDFAIELQSRERLTVTGYMGSKMFSKSMTWTKAPASLPKCGGSIEAKAPDKPAPSKPAPSKVAPSKVAAGTAAKSAPDAAPAEPVVKAAAVRPPREPAPRPVVAPAKAAVVPAPVAAQPVPVKRPPANQAAERPATSSKLKSQTADASASASAGRSRVRSSSMLMDGSNSIIEPPAPRPAVRPRTTAN